MNFKASYCAILIIYDLLYGVCNLFPPALVLVEAQFQCPVAGDECVAGNYPDPEWCAYYYSCFPNPLGGCEQQHIRCTPGWIFDWNRRICVNDVEAICNVPATSAIYAARTSSHSGVSVGPLPFDLGNENLAGNMWNNQSHIFQMKAARGFYFFALHGATRSGTVLDYNLMSGTAPVVGSGRGYSLPGAGDIVSRDVILEIFSDTDFSIGSTSGVYSSSGMDTGLAIFDLTETMAAPHDLVAFSVARDTFLIGETDPIPFNLQLVNAGGHYNDLSHRFLAPSGGIYFLCISTGLFSGTAVHVQMYLREDVYIDLNRRSTHHTDTDIISRCIMTQMSQNDEVHMVNLLGEAALSSSLLEMSFSGFKYEPTLGSSLVAWSVARTTSAAGNLLPVTFDTTLVNEGPTGTTRPWQPGDNSVLIPETGVYFVHLSVGLQANQVVTFGLRRNTSYELYAARRTTNHNDQDVTARSALRQYQANDVLTIGTNGFARIYSDARMQTAFMGFLLY